MPFKESGSVTEERDLQYKYLQVALYQRVVI